MVFTQSDTKFDLRPSGVGTTFNEIVPFVQSRWAQKDQIWRERKSILEAQTKIIDKLEDHNRHVTPTDTTCPQSNILRPLYMSSLLNVAHNVLQPAKLNPDFLDFQADRIIDDGQATQRAEEGGRVSQLMRRKGRFKKAVNAGKRDLIRGEQIFQRGWKFDPQGNAIRPEYVHVPWEEMRLPYDSTDWIRKTDYTVSKFISIWGKEMLKKALA